MILLAVLLVCFSQIQCRLINDFVNSKIDEKFLSDIINHISNTTFKYDLIIFDESVQNEISIDDILNNVEEPQYLIVPSSIENINEGVPSTSIQKESLVAFIIISDYPKWLSGDIIWHFSTIVVVNINVNWDAKAVLENNIIQNSKAILLFEKSNKSTSFDKYEVFTSYPLMNKSSGESGIKQYLGFWDPSSYNTESTLFPERFESLNGEVLHLATDHDDFPLIYQYNDGIYGTNINIMQALGSWLNFSFTTTFDADDENWGEKINGTWNGLLAMVTYGDKNLTINYFTLIDERKQDFDFSVPYLYEGFGFFMKTPPPLPAWQSLVYPLSITVWGCVGITLILVPLSLRIIIYTVDYYRSIINTQTKNPLFEAGLIVLKVRCLIFIGKN